MLPLEKPLVVFGKLDAGEWNLPGGRPRAAVDNLEEGRR